MAVGGKQNRLKTIYLMMVNFVFYFNENDRINLKVTLIQFLSVYDKNLQDCQ